MSYECFKKCYEQARFLLEMGVFLLLGNVAMAQSLIGGRVVDAESGEPLAGVTVVVNDVQGRLLKYAITARDGSFGIDLGSERIKIGGELVFSYMGYTQVRERLEGDTEVDAVNRRRVIKMKPSAIQINEVVVKAPKVEMRGDTISYNVRSFANTQDKTIGDVLKRIPGIEVNKEGQIKYNGETINKFYIEGADLLEGRYGLATNNINQKDVAKVEVLENHQPIKALKNVNYSDKAAINIKLNEGAKAKWLGQISGQGGGSESGDFLWNARLFAMSIGAKMQSLTTFKTNNTGDILGGESNSFTLDELSANGAQSYALPRYINVSPASTPNLDLQRTSFNRSALFNSSNLWKVGRDYTVKADVSYYYNQIKNANISQTDYFFENGKQIVNEMISSKERENGVLANINISANTDHYFLKNTLKTKLNWRDVNTHLQWKYANVTIPTNKSAANPKDEYPNMEGSKSPNTQNDTNSFKEVLQLAHTPSFYISNDFQIVKKLDKAILTAVSVNKLMHEPEKLNVSPYLEKINSSAFFTDEYVSLTHRAGHWNVTTTAGVSAVLRRMRRENDTLDNILNHIDGYAKLRAVYENSRLRITFDLPLNYYKYWYKVPLLHAGNAQNGSLFFAPRIALKWQMSPKLWVNLSTKVGKSPISTSSFFAGSVLSNYRSVQQGNILDATDSEYSMYLGVSYQNPLNLFHASLSASRNFYEKGSILQQTFSGDYIIQSQVVLDNRTGMWILNGKISKGVDFIKGKIALDANYSVYDMQSIVNNQLTPYRSQQLDVKTTISSNFAEWGNLDYDLHYGRSDLKMDVTVQGRDHGSATNMVKQLLSINLIPFRWLIVNMQGEHYYNQLTAELSQHLYWVDAGITFKIGKQLELNASVTNLLNRKTYSYTIYSGLSSVSRQYAIRPRNIMTGIYWAF